jgi:ketosteroid isomerase-like protein
MGMERGEVEARVRAVYQAISGAGDPRPAFSDRIVWHVPGQNPVSGVYRGAEEYFGTMVERMGPLDDWRIVVRDVFTNENDRAALVSFHLVGSRRGVDVDMDGFHLVRLDEDGLILEGWGFAEDQDALDRFFSV